jgi:hypothetical protein
VKTKRIIVKRPHQTYLERGDQKGDKKLIAPLTIKQKGCANTNEAKEDLNEKVKGVQS